MDDTYIFDNPEFIRLNQEFIRLADIVVREGEASLNGIYPRSLRLIREATAMRAAGELLNVLHQLDEFPEIRAAKKEFAETFGVEFPEI